MQGLSVGVIVSGSMSILGRVYAPGLRKTRVFSAMAAMAPFGFWLGAIQGGALTAHLPWIFGSNAILCGLCAVAAYFTIPALSPVADIAGADAPTIRDFDWKGALLATAGCVCLLFGLTQGTITHWSPYTYVLIIVGAVLLAAFFFVEHKVHRPLIPNSLWKTTGFAPLMAAYFLGFGGFVVRFNTTFVPQFDIADKSFAGRMAILRYAILPKHPEQVCSDSGFVLTPQRSHGRTSNIHRCQAPP
jgi:hypothetical protein